MLFLLFLLIKHQGRMYVDWETQSAQRIKKFREKILNKAEKNSEEAIKWNNNSKDLCKKGECRDMKKSGKLYLL